MADVISPELDFEAGGCFAWGDGHYARVEDQSVKA